MDLFPLTLGGLIVLGVSLVAVLRYGVGRLDLVLLVIGTLALSIAALSLLCVVIGAIVVFASFRNRRADQALEMECGHGAGTGFSIPYLWFLPFAEVSWTWESPGASVRLVRDWTRLREQVTLLRRGEHAEVVRHVEIHDVFGLARIAFPLREARRIRAVPGIGALKNVHVVQGMAGGDALSHPDGSPEGDRLDMRHYSAGDPIRFVLWKVFARSRQLVVRTPERALSPVQKTVAYLVAGAGDEPAAGAARVAVAGGALGSDWVLGADGVEDTARMGRHALDLIVRSAQTDPTGAGAGLAPFLRAAGVTTRRAVVFVPARPGPWIERVVAAASSGTTRLDVLVCTDGFSQPVSRSWLARAFFAAPAGPTREADDLLGVVRALSGTRARVLIVDRVAGRVYPATHLRGLEAA